LLRCRKGVTVPEFDQWRPLQFSARETTFNFAVKLNEDYSSTARIPDFIELGVIDWVC
jgi:hypothetical protein